MRYRFGDFVSAFLPLVPLCLIQGCGGGDEPIPAAVSVPAPVTVAPVPVHNEAPTILAAAIDDAKVGESFDYQPVVADAEHDALHFTATNLPAWASLDPTSGRISGMPSANDVGTYVSVTIHVADGTHVVTAAPFSINVVQGDEIGTGVASLQWQLPTSKVSGDVLDDLAGYRILYGRDRDDLDHSVLVTDPTLTSYQFSTLMPGTWYFAVVAVSASGLEGPPTAVATKSI